jgi:hypothetical protein
MITDPGGLKLADLMDPDQEHFITLSLLYGNTFSFL